MKEVLIYIEAKRQEFDQLPFFNFLRNKDIDPRQRLTFVPCIIPLIMSLGDVNKYFFREEPTNDPIQAMLNQHTYEDDHHWIWFLEDFQKLGFDHSMKISDTLRFLWNEETQKTRQVCYKLAALTFQADPALRLAVVEANEATGNVFGTTATQVAQELQNITKQEYRYFGKHHLDVETGHTTGQPDVEAFIENIQLSAKKRKQAVELVDEVFNAFTESVNEFMAYAEAHKLEQPLLVA